MSLLQMSVSGAVLILVIIVVRALAVNKLPKKTFLILWGIALVRLLIPYSAPSAFSLYSLLGRAFTATGLSDAVPASPTAPDLAITTVAPGAAIPVVPAVNGAQESAIAPWKVIWFMGVLACALFFVLTYWKCRREFQQSLPVEHDGAKDWLREHPLRRPIDIRYFDRIAAPLTYGVFRPVILMPKWTDWHDTDGLKYILTHEYIHIRRFDVVTKLALTAAVCVHWFNPAVWIMYILFNRDIELSCDEAVVRLFGESAKSAYAMTLIRMEETRSGLTPLCNNFSKNAIEERIDAIMKMKKTSMAALFAAAALIAGVTIGFATSAQAVTGKSTDERTAASSMTVARIEGDLLSYMQGGETYYSWDGGETWTPMTEEEFAAASRLSDVEWWTAEEYAEWLEQEKRELQSIIGEKSWNPTDGWYTWTQEMVDQAIARYEQTLKDIESGMKVSKPTGDGDTEYMFSYDPNFMQAATDTSVASTFVGFDAQGRIPNGRVASRELLEEYKAFGLIYDEEKELFTWKGKLVRYFSDEYEVDGSSGIATIYSYANGDGVVDLRTVRQATQNADGSIDPGGKLAGIEECSQEEFDNRVILNPDLAEETVASGFTKSSGGMTIGERFAKYYKDFGITYVEAEGVSGRGNVYLNGQPVHRFSDITPAGGTFSFTSADEGGINVRTVYDSDGRLVGVELVGE